DLDGGGLVVSGAQVVQARCGRAGDCGAAARKRRGRARAAAQWRASGAAAAWSGEQAARERRRRSGERARVWAAVSREGRKTVSETDAWARGRIKRKTERAGPPTLSTGRSDGSKKRPSV